MPWALSANKSILKQEHWEMSLQEDPWGALEDWLILIVATKEMLSRESWYDQVRLLKTEAFFVADGFLPRRSPFFRLVVIVKETDAPPVLEVTMGYQIAENFSVRMEKLGKLSVVAMAFISIVSASSVTFGISNLSSNFKHKSLTSLGFGDFFFS